MLGHLARNDMPLVNALVQRRRIRTTELLVAIHLTLTSHILQPKRTLGFVRDWASSRTGPSLNRRAGEHRGARGGLRNVDFGAEVRY